MAPLCSSLSGENEEGEGKGTTITVVEGCVGFMDFARAKGLVRGLNRYPECDQQLFMV
jgi:hypothetical protein